MAGAGDGRTGCSGLQRHTFGCERNLLTTVLADDGGIIHNHDSNDGTFIRPLSVLRRATRYCQLPLPTHLACGRKLLHTRNQLLHQNVQFARWSLSQKFQDRVRIPATTRVPLTGVLGCSVCVARFLPEAACFRVGRQKEHGLHIVWEGFKTMIVLRFLESAACW